MKSTYFERILDLNATLKSKSAFLFGPRSTGKSTLIKHQLKPDFSYDLLDPQVCIPLIKSPGILFQELGHLQNQLVVIDEIQKIPALLDDVHRLIFHSKHRFLLTGSSARKIKRSGVNLLGGRARELFFFPLTSHEIPKFDLMRLLNHGGLPDIYLSNEPNDDLRAYVNLYLKEEIAAEALTRNLEAFAQFFDAIALNNGEELHFQNIANDTMMSAKTIQNYIQILEDTLVGFSVPAFKASRRRKAIVRSKFFLFDLGVTNHLARRGKIEKGSELFGKAFEHFIALELRAALRLLKCDHGLSYWRTKSGFEVDFILGKKIAIEVKTTENITDKHLRGLRALKEENMIERYVVIASVPRKRTTTDGIEILPWQSFLEQLWSGKLF